MTLFPFEISNKTEWFWQQHAVPLNLKLCCSPLLQKICIKARFPRILLAKNLCMSVYVHITLECHRHEPVNDCAWHHISLVCINPCYFWHQPYPAPLYCNTDTLCCTSPPTSVGLSIKKLCAPSEKKVLLHWCKAQPWAMLRHKNRALCAVSPSLCSLGILTVQVFRPIRCLFMDPLFKHFSFLCHRYIFAKPLGLHCCHHDGLRRDRKAHYRHCL